MPTNACPRCGQPASGTARRRGRCTSCGAPLATASGPTESEVRAYLYGDRHLHLVPLGTGSSRRRTATR